MEDKRFLEELEPVLRRSAGRINGKVKADALWDAGLEAATVDAGMEKTAVDAGTEKATDAGDVARSSDAGGSDAAIGADAAFGDDLSDANGLYADDSDDSYRADHTDFAGHSVYGDDRHVDERQTQTDRRAEDRSADGRRAGEQHADERHADKRHAENLYTDIYRADAPSDSSSAAASARNRPCGCADVAFLDELSAPSAGSAAASSANYDAAIPSAVSAAESLANYDAAIPSAGSAAASSANYAAIPSAGSAAATSANYDAAIPSAGSAASSPPSSPSSDAPSAVIQSAYEVARASGLPLRLVLVMNRARDASPREYLLPETPADWRVATVLTHERLRDACHRWGVSAALLARVNLINPAGYVYPGQRFLLPK